VPTRAADLSTPAPDGVGTFTGFGNVALSQNVTVFEADSLDAEDNTVTGLYIGV